MRTATPTTVAEPLALTIPNACRAIGVGRTWLYEAARRGDLKLIRLGGRTVVPMTELRRLLAEAA
ncbi:MAG: helix-turn-helix domain-containing protein [Caulobacteraceae bacterium]